MENIYLIINTGSASKKYALYSENQEIFKAHLETEDGGLVSAIKIGVEEKKETITQERYDNSINYIIERLLSDKLITDIGSIKAVGLRIVAPGEYFLSDKMIDAEYLAKLQEAKNRAPLHIEPELAEIEHLKKTMPDTPIIGISDSAFHKTMPDRAKLYGLPRDIASRLEIYRYGYHGISAQSIVNKIKNWLGDIPPKIIICHLGSGSSIIALKNGQSVDASMGFTPLEGVIMSTRTGNIDAGAVIYLAQNLGLDLNNLEALLNQKCGLLGISGQTSDIRELLKLETVGDKMASTALEIFVYTVKKYIGAYTAALGGLDLLVFTATIGERSFIMRSRICRELSALGIVLDEEKNESSSRQAARYQDEASPLDTAAERRGIQPFLLRSDKLEDNSSNLLLARKNNSIVSMDGFINKGEGHVKIAVIATDEMGEMAKQTRASLNI